MGSFNHKLKSNASSQFPRNIVYVDTEANIVNKSNGEQHHFFDLGVACYVYKPTNRRKPREEWFTFYDVETFWNTSINLSEKDRTLLILAYNIGYDIRLLDGFRILDSLGYQQQRLYIGQTACILQFKKDKHKILILDACNYFHGTLESWGKMLGLDKVQVNFSDTNQSELEVRCKQDVLILKTLWETWYQFVQDNDLGCFAPTTPSQAFNAFRHRFMYHDIYVHANKEAIELERNSYFGGRVECYHIGDVPDGPFYKVDVNSMYPYVMTNTPVPIRLLTIWEEPSIKQLRSCIKRFSFIADVEIETGLPVYPTKVDSKLVWPVGRFRATLAEPELQYALEHNHIKHIYKCNVYEKAVIFDRYINWAYEARLKYKQDNNIIFSTMVKLLMNSLYGKFGQRSEKWQKGRYIENLPDGFIDEYDGESGTIRKGYAIAGQEWLLVGREEGFHACPGIASTITSAARMHLWELISVARRVNVFYMDTDSLIVNIAGYRNLSPFIDEHTLGKLKLEYKTRTLCLRAPKSYKTDTEDKCKGLTKSAQQIGEHTYSMMQWQGLRGALHDGILNQVVLIPRTKHFSTNYTKGNVDQSGSVSPLSL